MELFSPPTCSHKVCGDHQRQESCKQGRAHRRGHASLPLKKTERAEVLPPLPPHACPSPENLLSAGGGGGKEVASEGGGMRT